MSNNKSESSWSREDTLELLKAMNQDGKVVEKAEPIAEKTGRSVSACLSRYYYVMWNADKYQDIFDELNKEEDIVEHTEEMKINGNRVVMTISIKVD